MTLESDLANAPDLDVRRRKRVRAQRLTVVAVSVFCVMLMAVWSFFRLAVCWDSQAQGGWLSAACQLDSVVHLLLLLGLGFLIWMIFQLSSFGGELLSRLEAFDASQLQGLDRMAEQRFGEKRIAGGSADSRLRSARLKIGVARQELEREGPGLGTWIAVGVSILIVLFLLFGPFDSLWWQS